MRSNTGPNKDGGARNSRRTHIKTARTGHERCDVRWRCDTDQGDVLLDVGAVGQVGENGVHVLDVSDADGQVGEPRQRSQFVLILRERQKLSICMCIAVPALM